ncbi:MAG: A/G-specific adenine glycosylase [Coxiellaceae bacterium]|nr:A/G-specific adenine glycosylase [Coxiellaceae bacterium]
MKNFARRLIRWQQRFGRHDLPWQHNPSAYRVWISEIMLQQTQVTTVIPYYQRFMRTLPSLKQLANAPQDDVLHLWSGLGYYSRARNLHKTAQLIQSEFKGRFPKDVDTLITLPGIGRSTAGAIASFAFNQPTVILDGNVKRVLARTHAIEGWYGKADVLKRYWQLAEQLTPANNTQSYNQGLMDLGSSICTRSKPICSECPLKDDCIAFQTDTIKQYPTPKAKANSRRIEQRYFVIVINKNNQILLYRRPESGIWGGLWSLPECGIERDLRTVAQDNWGLELESIQHLTPRSHQFSHYQLDLFPILATTTSNQIDLKPNIWYNFDQPLPGGIAAPIQRILQEYQHEQSGFLSTIG